MKSLLIRTLILFILLTLSYYLFFFLPKQRALKAAAQDLQFLNQIYSPLLQNHLALTAIPLLDPNAPNFAVDQDNLLSLLRSSREQTLKLLTTTSSYQTLITDTKALLETQPDLIDNYQPDSPNVATYITKQRQLLEQYQQEINKLKRILTPPQR